MYDVFIPDKRLDCVWNKPAFEKKNLVKCTEYQYFTQAKYEDSKCSF